MASHAQTPQFILFGDSLTMWAFDEENGGFGWFLGSQYGEKVVVRNEGVKSIYCKRYNDQLTRKQER